MHVAMLLSTPLPPQEGIGQFALHLARFLRGAGHEVTFLTRGNPKDDVDVDGFPVVRFPVRPIYPFHVQWQGKAVRRWLKKHGHRFDVVHAHMPLVPAIDPQVPMVTTFHTPLRAQFRGLVAARWRDRLWKWSARYNERLEEAMIAHSDIVTGVSEGMADALWRDYGAQGVMVTPNGVDTETFSPPVEGEARAVGRWLYTGRLARRKGLPDLLEALARLARAGTPFEMVLTGKGEYAELLKRQAESLGIAGRVRFTGFISRDELRRLYRTCEALVFPTHYEGMPTAVLEAMASGMPIVTTDAPGVAGLIEDGAGGYVVPVGDPEALAKALQRFARTADAEKVSMGRANRERAVARHTWTAAGAAALAAYRAAGVDDVGLDDKP